MRARLNRSPRFSPPAPLRKVRVMLAGVDSVGIGINPVEGWNSWMILFFIGVIVVGVSRFSRVCLDRNREEHLSRSRNQQRTTTTA